MWAVGSWMSSSGICLRLAYHSTVIALHEPNAASKTSCGVKPRSSPPLEGGSSIAKAWLRTLTVCFIFCERSRAMRMVMAGS